MPFFNLQSYEHALYARRQVRPEWFRRRKRSDRESQGSRKTGYYRLERTCCDRIPRESQTKMESGRSSQQSGTVCHLIILPLYHCIISALGERKPAYSFTDVVTCSLIEGPGTCQNPYTRRHSSRERCWMHRESRRNEEGNIRGRESRNQKRRRGQLLSQNRHSRVFSMFDIFFVFHTYSRFLSHIFRIEYPSFILSRPSSPSVYYRHNYLSAAYHTPHLILILPSFCPSHRHNWPIIPASQIPNPTSGDKPPLNFI